MSAPPLTLTLRVQRVRAPGTPFAWLESERGELVLGMESRAVVRVGEREHLVDTDHVVAQYDARDRFDRDRGEGIL